jgi:hypothetical protein
MSKYHHVKGEDMFVQEIQEYNSEEAQKLPMLDWNEFVEGGYLLEINRRVLHPVGLSMVVIFDNNNPIGVSITDQRKDNEGILLKLTEENISSICEKHKRYTDELLAKELDRLNNVSVTYEEYVQYVQALYVDR